MDKPYKISMPATRIILDVCLFLIKIATAINIMINPGGKKRDVRSFDIKNIAVLNKKLVHPNFCVKKLSNIQLSKLRENKKSLPLQHLMRKWEEIVLNYLI